MSDGSVGERLVRSCLLGAGTVWVVLGALDLIRPWWFGLGPQVDLFLFSAPLTLATLGLAAMLHHRLPFFANIGAALGFGSILAMWFGPLMVLVGMAGTLVVAAGMLLDKDAPWPHRYVPGLIALMAPIGVWTGAMGLLLVGAAWLGLGLAWVRMVQPEAPVAAAPTEA